MVRLLPLAATLALSASAWASDTVPLLKDCSNPAEIVAAILNTDRVEVHSALAGDQGTCYAVSAMSKGNRIEGYMIGAAHPDVAAFEREARSRIPAIPELPPPDPVPAPDVAVQSKSPAGEIPKSFAGLSGASPTGRRVSLDQLSAPTVVLYFWSTNDKKSIREADAMDAVWEMYHQKGVAVVGIVSGASVAQVRHVLNDGEVVWPQILDNGEVAMRHPEIKETKYFILDRNRNVVAALKTPEEVQRELLKRRKQTGGAE